MSRLYHNSLFAMNTRCYILLPDMSDSEADRLFQTIRSEILRIENKISRFLPTSDLSSINKKAARQPVPVDEEMFSILKTCIYYYKKTKGRFDITLRPLMRYWQNGASNSKFRLKELRDSLGTDGIQLDKDQRTVKFKNPELEIDLGGFGKGYALEQVDNILAKHQVSNIFISFGESSILTKGHHPAGSYWKIGLKDYRDPNRTIYDFSVNDASISTSSNFFVNDNGKLVNHRHIIHPFTGMPIEACLTSSVCSKSAIEAEVLSTAYLVDAAAEKPPPPPSDSEITIVSVNYDTESVEMEAHSFNTSANELKEPEL